MTRVAIVGGAGYTGAELVRLLAGHPEFDLTLITSDAHAGAPVADVYPALASVDLAFETHDPAAVVEAADVAFLAVPHTAAMDVAADLLDAGLAVFDLSADFRLAEPSVFEAWYGTPHTAAHLLAQAVYGLPEVDRTHLPGARLVACPGCYPTATLIAASPALAMGIAGGRLVVDAKSGVSGAGKKATATTHYCSADESLAPYGVPGHRHTPEIAAGLAKAAGREVAFTFVPHLAPMKRGLLSTVYLDAEDGLTSEVAQAKYAEHYAGEPFVTVHPLGRMPATSEVTGSNRAHLGVAVDTASGTLIVACAIDNLVKGAGGQAVQCANLALGLPETAGLDAIAPVV